MLLADCLDIDELAPPPRHHELTKRLQAEMAAGRHNSWSAALLRGIRADYDALEYVAERATALTPTPLPEL